MKSILVLLSLVLCASVASAELVTIDDARQERHGAWGSNIGVAGQQIIANNGFTAWNADENGEYRNLIQFDVQSSVLGFDSSDVVSATLKWNYGAWGAGRNAVTIDQTVSYLGGGGTSFAFMYGNTIASAVFSEGGTGAGIGSVDITAAFIAAMGNATADSGIAYRWYNDNDADPTAPYAGGGSVVLNTGYGLSGGATIDVEVVPEPATLGLFGLVGGAMLFFRRKLMV